MSSDIAIRVENLGKRYVLGRETHRAATLAGRVRQTLASPFSWLTSQMRGPSEEEILWALKDVSFEVKRGEVLGVIGRNGAGKSTLLKILSRITEPTTGHAEIHGRIGALLEVGTGMHPELTGRENIYLNGTILGMRKTEIDTKFDEIVDFSGIERFLDTQVKRYSSGMRVRLGFAIAAHLEPEILVIDEVLAVGDAEFQKKCLGKMKDVAGHGRTVLFVSHNMSAVKALCTRGIVLEEGRSVHIGEVSDVVARYLGKAKGERKMEDYVSDCTNGSAVAAIARVGILRGDGEDSSDSVLFHSPLVIEIDIYVSEQARGLFLSVQAINSSMQPVTHLWNDFASEIGETKGIWRVRCTVPRTRLYMGDYFLRVFLSRSPSEGLLDSVDGVCHFSVSMDSLYRRFPYSPNACYYVDDAQWTSEKVE